MNRTWSTIILYNQQILHSRIFFFILIIQAKSKCTCEAVGPRVTVVKQMLYSWMMDG